MSSSAYAELGLEPGASESEVKAAWRRLASQWHPDRNPRSSAVDTMQRINQAFEAIRRAGFAEDVPGEGATAEAPPAAAPEAAPPPPPRQTINRRVKLTLEEAAAGCTKVLRGKLTEPCSHCEGAGEWVVEGGCEPCGGTGSVRQRSWYGLFSALSECEACSGAGNMTQRCGACAGSGKVELRKYATTVRFPHGVRDGDLLHVDASRLREDQAPVNLDIRVELAPHALFALDADGTVRCEVPVDGFTWVANRAVDVPTLSGLQRLQLERNTLVYRLGGSGFPTSRRGARGDHVVTVVPRFPQRLSTDQEILFDQLVATGIGPDGQSLDTRLRNWNEALRAWERPAA